MAQRTTAPDIPGFAHLGWIGGGGFADVFSYQDALGRRVAVKVQHRGVDGGAATAFHAEATLMAKLSTHPNIVTIHNSGVSADGRPFLVMEECSTSHLGARVAKRTQTTSKAMEVIIQVAGAVETAHRMGILHRDIKPANILFTEFGRPALTDFGISVSGESGLAGGGLSPLWAPPEQHPNSGMAMGPWSDVFSLAATMWAMLVGRSPLEVPDGANDRLSLMHRARTFTPSVTGRHDVPETLERVLQTALAREPGQRYQSALEFARAIQGVQGQLNESVTPIDVLDDHVEEDYQDDPESTDTGTRVSGFMLIDPDAVEAGSTVTSTGPTGGITSPHEHSGPNAVPVPAGGPGPLVAQHGRGHASPGLRDFTAPGVPEGTDHTVIDAAFRSPTAASAPTRKRSPLAGIAVSAAVVLVVGAGMWGLWASGILDGEQVVASTPTQSTTPKAQDPLAARVPPVEDLVGTLDGDRVTFSWTNPDPQAGDKYVVEELSTAEASPLEVVTETTVGVAAQPGQTCVQVSLRRGNGKVSAPVRECVQS